jgi:hypothetical protein
MNEVLDELNNYDIILGVILSILLSQSSVNNLRLCYISPTNSACLQEESYLLYFVVRESEKIELAGCICRKCTRTNTSQSEVRFKM